MVQNQQEAFAVDMPQTGGSKCFDDDGRIKRTGNNISLVACQKNIRKNVFKYLFGVIGSVWTASAHIITAVIGSGVLSLAWATAQLGWLAGPVVMLLFSIVTYFTSTLLAACYRSGDPISGKRNYTYMDAVRSNLGKIQYLNESVEEIREYRIFNMFFIVLDRWREGQAMWDSSIS